MLSRMDASSAVESLERHAAHRPGRLCGRNPWLLLLAGAQRFGQVRVTGLAAEMSFFMLLSLIPLLTALGAGLGLVERLSEADDLQAPIVEGVELVFGSGIASQLIQEIIEPLLREERTGLTIGGLAVTLWLASRVFRSTLRALEDTYELKGRRSPPAQYGLALLLVGGAVVVVVLLLAVIVVGPLLGGGQRVAGMIGMEAAFRTAWAVAQWPVVIAVAVGYLTLLYRLALNTADHTWKDCLPGALVGTAGLVLVLAGFRLYLAFAGARTPDLGEEAMAVAAQAIGVLTAVMLLTWLSSIAVLTGAVINAEWLRQGPKASRESSAPSPEHG